jgi:ribosomal protein S21
MREFNYKRERYQAREYGSQQTQEYGNRDFPPPEPHNTEHVGRSAHVRVVLKKKFNDPDKNYKEMLADFRRRVSTAGVLREFKEHQFYESKSEKRRKAKRCAQKKLLMDVLTKRMLAGERIEGHGGMVKKIQSNLKKEKEKKEKKRERQGERATERNNRHYDD